MIQLGLSGNTIAVSGQIDAESAEEFEGVCSKVADEIGGDVTLDLTGVTFMGSSGVGALIGLRTRLIKRRRKLLVRTSPPVMEILELSGLGTVIDLV